MESVEHRARISNRVEWRLTGHFFRAMFDFGILTQAGTDSLIHMLLGTVGVIIAIGFGLTRIYAGKYAALSGARSPEPYRIALLGDDLFLIGLPMLLVGLLTLLVSHSLFPDERDYRILGPLPVSKPAIFGAKLMALLLANGILIGLVHFALIPMVLLTSINRFRQSGVVARLAAWLIASVTGSLFTVLAIAASVGVVMLTLSRSRMHALTALTRSLMLGALVLCVPMTFHLPALGPAFAAGARSLLLVPPAWFVGLQRVLLGSGDPWFLRLAVIALAAFAIVAVVVAAVYIVLFKHVELLLLRPPSISAPWSNRYVADISAHAERVRNGLSHGPASPGFRAVHQFTTATIRRCQLHQGVLVGLSACGVALVTNSLTGTNLAGRLMAGGRASAALVSAAAWMPFALMFACGVAVRAALALPAEHRANWIFRLTEEGATRGDQMRAVDRLVTGYVVGMPVVVAAPILWLTFGSAGAIALIVVAACGLVSVHGVLLDWRRIPFTCSYLPGKRLIAHTLVLGFAAFVLFTTAGLAFVYTATASVAYGLVIATGLFALGWSLRQHRLATWQQMPLMFEDELPDQLLQLGL